MRLDIGLHGIYERGRGMTNALTDEVTARGRRVQWDTVRGDAGGFVVRPRNEMGYNVGLTSKLRGGMVLPNRNAAYYFSLLFSAALYYHKNTTQCSIKNHYISEDVID